MSNFKDKWFPLNGISARKYGIERMDIEPYKMPSGGYNLGGTMIERFIKPIMPDYVFYENIRDNRDNSYGGYGLTDIIGPLYKQNGELFDDFAELSGNWYATGLGFQKNNVNGYFPQNPKEDKPYGAFTCNEANAWFLEKLMKCEKSFRNDKWEFYDKFQNKIEIPLLNCTVDGEKMFNTTLLLNKNGNGGDFYGSKYETIIGLLLTDKEVKLITKNEKEKIEKGKYIGNTIYHMHFYGYKSVNL